MTPPREPDPADATLQPPDAGRTPPPGRPQASQSSEDEVAVGEDSEVTLVPGEDEVTLGRDLEITLLPPADGSGDLERTRLPPSNEKTRTGEAKRAGESGTRLNRVTDSDATHLSGVHLNRAAAPAPDPTYVTDFKDHDPHKTEVDSQRTDGPMEFEATRTFPGSVPQPGAAPNAAAPGAVVGRFALRSLHAKGGLGEVFTARDTELNREVALKRIQARFADEPSSRRRFLTEARITARLDHPGVVPVFGLVADGAGRPCYAMRFIRGESLKDEADRYHRPPAPAPSAEEEEAAPATVNDRRIAFRQLLQRFIAVCQAIAYAHTRNVIHRDIKPANVMVGTFGETLVVDWGLAKALDEPTTADEPRAASGEPTDDPDATEATEQTAAGVAVGTPAYMSPEQAAGRADLLGPASDIYSLGATLYYVLTGRAPFTGSDPTDTITRVRRGDFPPPRTLNPHVPPPLEAICLTAMATQPAERYPSARALAADVERWLSDEPVSCYHDPLGARVARWVRRNPARVAGTLSLLGSALIAIVIILVVVDGARQRTQQSLADVTKAEEKTKAAFAQVTEQKGQTDAALVRETTAKEATERQKQIAERAADLARSRFTLARNSFETVVHDVQAQLDDRAGAQVLRRQLLEQALEGLAVLCATAESAPTADSQEAHRLLFWARLQMGDVRKGLGNTAGAAGEYEIAVKAARELRAASPDSTETRQNLATALDRLADISLAAGRTDAAVTAARDALALRERLHQDAGTDPAARRELAAAFDRLAVVLLEQGNTKDAVTAAGRSIAERTTLHSGAPADTDAARDLARAHDRAADIALRTGNTAAAEKAARAAIALREQVAKALSPDRVEVRRELAAAHSRLGEVHFERADMTHAREAYQHALQVLNDIVARDRFSAGAKVDAAATHGRIGSVQLRTGDAAGAVKETQVALELGDELSKADPGSARARRTLGSSLIDRGDAQLAHGEKAPALESFEQSLALFEGLAKDDPGSARAKLDVAEARQRVGDAELAAGRIDAAIEHLKASAAARADLAKSDADSARVRRQLALGHLRLSDAYLKAENLPEAEAAAERAVGLCRELAEKDPGSGQARRDLATGYAKWGEVTMDRAELTATALYWSRSLDGFDGLVQVDAANAQAQEDRAAALGRIARVYAAAGYPTIELRRETEALGVREAVAKAHPDSLVARLGVMVSKRRLGDLHASRRTFDAAARYYQEARAVATKSGDAPVFADELKTLADRAEVLDALRAGASSPAGMAKAYPADVRARALIVLVADHLRQNETVNADRAAGLLAQYARGPNDLYLAAKGYAGCAAKTQSAAARTRHADDAVATLAKAAAAGYRKPDDLKSATWDVVRERPDFKAAEAAIRANVPKTPKE